MSESTENGLDAHDGPGHVHVCPWQILVGVWAALTFLTVVTVWAAMLDLHGWDFIVAMGIATVKGSLVALFFMHLLYDKLFNTVVFVSSILFMVLFLAMALTDSLEYLGDINQLTSDSMPGTKPGGH